MAQSGLSARSHLNRLPHYVDVAFQDFAAAVHRRQLWLALASEDILDSHRRTVLGPIWPLLNYLLYVGTIVLFIGQGAADHFPIYVASGMLVWLYINDIASQSSTLFLREEGFIKGTVLPLSVYVLRQATVTAIRSGYALVGASMIVFYIGFVPTPALWSVVPAILLLLITAPGVVIVFAFCGVFYHDFQFVVSHVMRLMMFVTPVFWIHNGSGGVRGFLYHWNPLTHYLNIVRQPIVDGTIPVTSWAIAVAVSLIILGTAVFLLGKYNRRLVFLI